MPKPVQLKSVDGPGIMILWPQEGEPGAAGLPQAALDRVLTAFQTFVASHSGGMEGYASFEACIRSTPKTGCSYKGVAFEVPLL
jgi:hypothetical protein